MSTKTSKSTRIVTRAVSFVAAIAAASVFALFAHSTGHDDIARGVVTGASLTLLVILLLWIFGVRAGTAGRIASGEADERDKLNTRSALADAAKAMAVAALACMIAGLYGMAAPLVSGLVLWAGLIGGLASLTWRTLRG